MSDEINNIQSQVLDGMNKAVNHLETELVKVRAGKAGPKRLTCQEIRLFRARWLITTPLGIPVEPEV